MALFGIGLLATLPGLLSVPATDRDEARFAQATRQMLESGDYIRIRFQDEPRHKKPIGIHWVQAAAVRAVEISGLGDRNSIWPYRLPSALGAVMAVFALYGFARRWVGREQAWLAAALLAGSVLLVVEAHLATTDAALLATIVTAQGALGEIYRRARSEAASGLTLALVLWIALGGAVLLKGPVGPLVCGLTAVTLSIADRRWRWLGRLRPLIGLPIFAVIVAPWVIAVQIATGGAFIHDAFTGDLLPKLVGGHESHGFPPGFYLLLLTATFWPGSILTAAGFGVTWKRRRDDPVDRFLLAWLIPAWIVFELIPTKLPHYVLPLYPAVALITVRAIAASVPLGAAPSKIERAGLVIWSIVTLMMALVAAWSPRLIGDAAAGSAGLAVFALGLVAAILPSRLAWSGDRRRGLLAAVVAGVAFMAVLWQWLLPSLDALWVSREMAHLIPEDDTSVVAVVYHEPSLVFELGMETRLTGAEGAAEAVAEWQSSADAPPSMFAIVESAAGEAWRAALAERQIADPIEIGAVEGINYSKGSRVALQVYRFDR